MPLSEVRTYVNDFLSNHDNMDAIVYCNVKYLGNIYKLDISAEETVKLKNVFTNSLRDKISDESLSYMLCSAADARKDAIYEYDFEYPDEIKCLISNSFCDSASIFDFSTLNLKDMDMLAIHVGTQDSRIVFIKKISPINIFDRKKFFFKKAGNRLDRIDDDFIRIDDSFKLVYVNKKLLFFDIKFLEKMTSFKDIITREAMSAIEKIESINILSGDENFESLVDNMATARKLVAVAKNSPVIAQNVPADTIYNFCFNNKKISKKLRFNQNERKIILKSKISKKLFLSVLMDDVFTSELTHIDYESSSKDIIV